MRPYLPAYLLALVLQTAAQATVTPFLAKSLAMMLDALTAQSLANLLSGLAFIGVYVAVVSVLLVPLNHLFDYTSAKITANLRRTCFNHVQKLPVRYFKDNHSGELISRLTNDISLAEQFYASSIPIAAQLVVSAVVATAVMYLYDWRLASYALGITVAASLSSLAFARGIRRLSAEAQARLAEVTAKFSDVLDGAMVIKTFNLKDIILAGFGDKNKRVFDTSLKRVNRNTLLSAIDAIFGTACFGGTIILGAYMAIQGFISVGVILAVTQLQNSAAQVFSMAGGVINQAQGALAAADRVFDLLDTPVEPDRYSEIPAGQNGSYVSLQDVDFSYDGGEKVFDDLTLTAKQGEVVALVGPSGGGKTTIIKLLMGFYPPESGAVTIGEKPLSAQTLTELRAGIAYVPQDAYLFAGTVAENIRHGRLDATDGEIVAAAKAANAHDFIMELEHGYETVLGERGAQISGGQRQRIAIARALLKNAPLLLLDEATSALDTESERLVQDALERLMQNRTTFVVAHRLSTIRHADRILVIADGNVQEEGTHDELVGREGGLYRALYEQQFTGREEQQAAG
jgi:ABC-type multidrug transport system fused ATPase/permease subunit